jgi:hypothetical protein
VDDSSSMAGQSWAQAREALMGVAETAAQYDDQGVDIYFINSKRVGKELRASADVEDLFAGLEPRGTTPYVDPVQSGIALSDRTGLRLEAILREYMVRLERSRMTSPGLEGRGEIVKPLNLIVVTDGGMSPLFRCRSPHHLCFLFSAFSPRLNPPLSPRPETGPS